MATRSILCTGVPAVLRVGLVRKIPRIVAIDIISEVDITYGIFLNQNQSLLAGVREQTPP
jgi:hypothetical protein